MRTLALLLLCWAGSQASNYHVIEYNWAEGQPADMVIGDLSAEANLSRAIPLGSLNNFRFNTLFPDLVTVDKSTGRIRVKQVLDREAICAGEVRCVLTLDVVGKSLDQPTTVPTQTFKVTIVIIDINDNRPTFLRDEIVLSISEMKPPNSYFDLPMAEDADSGVFAVQEYRLDLLDCPPNLFDLALVDLPDGRKSLKLKLVGFLDREMRDSYQLVVIAQDGGNPPLSGSMLVGVAVVDANDNSPSFTNDSYEVNVTENIPVGTIILQVRARDPDLDVNGHVVYSLAEQTQRNFGEIFGIEEASGNIFTKRLIDFEETSSYQLKVKASDFGISPMSTTADVIIRVLDINDNPPLIKLNMLAEDGIAFVDENLEPNAFVVSLSVHDTDAVKGDLAECQIDDNRNFKLEPMIDGNYKIVTTKTFDRETKSEYRLIISCTEKGHPPLTSLKELKVMIRDTNDNTPLIAQQLYSIDVAENNAEMALLTTINATDADSDRNSLLHFTMKEHGDTPVGAVAISPKNGNVNARISFDYEKRHLYNYLVTVADQGDPSRSATCRLTIRIIDINDEKPRFERLFYYFSVTENLTSGSIVGRVNASDADVSAAFKEVFYRVESNDGAFDVDRTTGNVRLLKRLDREEQSVYRFIIVAYNAGGRRPVENRVNVTIYVDDVNDNIPSFLFPSEQAGNRVEISGDLPIGSLVTRLQAVDLDDGDNARLLYYISNGNSEQVFEIVESTGVINVAKDLKYFATHSNSFRLVVSVKDGGDPQLSSVADLTIVVNLSQAAGQTGFSTLLDPRNTIMLGIAAGTILLLIILCAVVTGLCLRRRRLRRRREDKGGKYVVTKVVDAFETGDGSCCQQARCSTSSNNKLNTINCRRHTAMNSSAECSSLRSDGNCSCTHRDLGGSQAQAANGCPLAMYEREEAAEDGEMCRIHDPHLMTNSWDQSCNVRITPSPKGCPDSHGNNCGLLPTSNTLCRNISGGQPYYQQHRCSCCTSHCHPPSNGCRAHRSQLLQPLAQYNSRKRSLYSPDAIPMQTRVGRDHDAESLCSGSTWTDSGRGPSEEDDHLRSAAHVEAAPPTSTIA